MHKLISHDGNPAYGLQEYVVDSAEDIKNLPHCDMGSTALVISTGEVYMADSKGEWHKL
jgi:hypothetical protein